MKEYKNFLTPEECQELIKMIDANHSRSSVVEGGTDRTAISDYRTSSTCNLSSTNELVNNIHNRIANVLNLDIKKGESLQGQLYEVGQYFKQHNDFFEGAGYDMHCKASGNRTHTFMVYLNEGIKGGGTNFPNLNKVVEPELGKALMWENMKDGKLQHQYLHEGVSVEEGKKYIITSWWREKAWDGAGDEKLALQPKVTQEEQVEKKSYIIKSSEKLTKPSVEEKIIIPETYTHKDQIPKFTELGFALKKCPEETWKIISDSYEILKEKTVNEEFAGKDEMIKGGESEIMSFDHLPALKNLIHQQLLPIHKEWIGGQNIDPSFIYGIRSYKRGATLTKHVDRVETHHISSIIIVDKDLTCGCQNRKYGDDWPLDIQGHDGEWYKVYAEPGDIILYESAICEHGREEPFQGTFFRNFYVHYKLTN
jgi:prolyl 4-hydroxylase